MSNSPFGNGQGSDGTSGMPPGLIKPPDQGSSSQPSGSPSQRTNPKSIPQGGEVVKPMPPPARIPAPSKPFSVR